MAGAPLLFPVQRGETLFVHFARCYAGVHAHAPIPSFSMPCTVLCFAFCAVLSHVVELSSVNDMPLP